MIRQFLRKQKVKDANFFVEPDEIFLDSKNLQNFDQQQFEGRIEKPISKKTVSVLSAFLVLFIVVFAGRLAYLQIEKGQVYLNMSNNNVLDKQVIFADRGIIYDRNKVELAWNTKDETQTGTDDFSLRNYLSPGFSHVLGYISYPKADATGNYWQSDFVGKDGLEKEYNTQLQGTNGSKIVETDAYKKVHSENIVDAPVRGTDLVTTLDSRIQTELYTLIKNLSGSGGSNSYGGGAGVMMDDTNGEIIASTSYPEYDSGILSLGKDSATIDSYLTDPRKVFLDRTTEGLYTPGSIVKPFLALGALDENIISPDKPILSTGSISIPNPFDPTKETVFKDWKAHGWTNMGQALAVSSDVYFYTIGGGFGDQKGLGITNIEKYANMFDIGTATGVDLPDESNGTVPSPQWKAINFKSDPTWRIGDTYHTAIGQYGFQVTPMEMARAVAAIANEGTLVTPHYLVDDTTATQKTTTVNISRADFEVVQDGMRQVVTYGTGVALNVPYVDVAAKTGTAQVGVANSKVNSWVIGFFPYEHPKYAFAVTMEAGPTVNTASASSIMRQLLDWMSVNTPEYFK